MLSYTIHPFVREYDAILPLVNLLTPEPITVEQLERSHESFPPDGLRHRTMAVDAAGQAVGYASTSFRNGQKPGRYYVSLVTGAEARRRGVGSALLADAEAWARASGAQELLASLSDADESWVQFGLHRGFTVEHYTLTNRLDLGTFDEADPPFAGVVSAAEQAGIRFLSYPDIAGEEAKRRIYELYKVTDMDTPGYAGTDPTLYPPYERWHEEIFGNEDTLLEGIILAVDGAELVGLTLLQRTEEFGPGGIYTEYTGVLQAYRNRQIGLALKLLSVRTARACGASYMTTRNSAYNGSMLAVNRKMGYEKVSGRYWLVKPL